MKLLAACYYLSRCGEYIKVTGSSIFPNKFCSVRWLENSCVAQRVLELLDNLKKFADLVVKIMKAIQSSASLKPISKFFEDKLITAKLAFFISLADDLEPFLREFQSDYPMIFYMEV